MNLNPNFQSLESLTHRKTSDSHDFHSYSPNTYYIKDCSNEHSRKTSSTSLKSLPLTSTSMTCETRIPKHDRKETFTDKFETKPETTKDFEIIGEDPYEIITQPEIPRLI